MLDLQEIGGKFELEVILDGLHDQLHMAVCGANMTVMEDEVIPAKTTGEKVVVGLSASHDGAVVLAVDGRLHTGIQIERLSRTKHDGSSILDHDKTNQLLFG